MNAMSAPDGELWWPDLHKTDRQEARDILENAAIILRKDGRLKGRLRWNEMLEAVEVSDVPWNKRSTWRQWTDADDLHLASFCQDKHAYLKPKTCAAAVQLVARDRMVHPVRDRLRDLKWDGAERLSRWLFTYLGVQTGPREGEDEKVALARELYHQEVGRKWMISAVARIYKPGCKADCALILEGAQGARKSSAAELLALEPEWFADELADLGTKDSAQDLRGKFIVEMAELSAMKRGEVERVKAFISRRIDHYRPSYGTRSQDFPRQCVFVGSTNESQYLKDHTGNRRFWPVKVGTIDLEALTRDRDQLWAEAVAAFHASERWWLDRDTEIAAAAEQAERRLEDAWREPVLEWLESNARSLTTVTEVLSDAIGMKLDQQGRQSEENRVARILNEAGWKRIQRRIGDRRKWFYVRPESAPTGDTPSGDTPTGDRPNGPKGPAPTGDTPPHTGDKTPPTGDKTAGKPSVSAGVTSVTSVTSRFTHTYTRARPALSKHQYDTGDTGDSPPWTDEQAWSRRFAAAASRDEMRAIALQMGKAADGIVLDGERPLIQLPRLLPKCPSLTLLRETAHHLQIEVVQ
jgi:predicted P-loop ATPase